MSGKVVVLGDALLDIDVVGTARRLSPDAPVPVVDAVREHSRPGGAALAAMLAATDAGAEVVLVAPVGSDEDGQALRALLDPHLDVVPLPLDVTPVKRRIRVGGQSLLRLDTGGGRGRIGDPPPDLAGLLASADAVLVS